MNKEVVKFIKRNGTDLDIIKGYIMEMTAYPNIEDADVYEILLESCFEFLEPPLLKFMFKELSREYKYCNYSTEKKPTLNKNLISKIMASYLRAHVLAEQIK